MQALLLILDAFVMQEGCSKNLTTLVQVVNNAKVCCNKFRAF